MELLSRLFKFFVFLCLFSFGCTKDNGIIENHNVDKLYARSNAFPTSIYLGPDITSPRTDSIYIGSATSYLNSCGTAPETESAWMGSTVWQIYGPSTANVKWTGSSLTLTNLVVGSYMFKGHAYVIGFRTCDSTYMNEQAFDTLYITILKSRKKR